jgi:hypothetical protein
MGEGVGGDCHANSARGEGKGSYVAAPEIFCHAYSREAVTHIPSLTKESYFAAMPYKGSHVRLQYQNAEPCGCLPLN